MRTMWKSTVSLLLVVDSHARIKSYNKIPPPQKNKKQKKNEVGSQMSKETIVHYRTLYIFFYKRKDRSFYWRKNTLCLPLD